MRNIPNGSLDWTALAKRSNPLANRSDPLRVSWILQNAIYPALMDSNHEPPKPRVAPALRVTSLLF